MRFSKSQRHNTAVIIMGILFLVGKGPFRIQDGVTSQLSTSRSSWKGMVFGKGSSLSMPPFAFTDNYALESIMLTTSLC